MKAAKPSVVKAISKANTGIEGFDKMIGGGLPRGRTTLLVGGPGSGKTIFGLQFLVHGAVACKEPGIFVAFEEAPERIVANAQGLGWPLEALQAKQLFFLNGQLQPDIAQSGDFDLSGLCAALEIKAKQMKARRIVFDALDIVLALLPDDAARKRELHRLHGWLLAQGLTGIITLKADADDVMPSPNTLQFMVDCVVILNHSIVLGVSQRTIHIQKCRGSGFDENESAFLIGRKGFEVAVASAPSQRQTTAGTERISSGVERLDTMLGGGYYRSASVLITGFSGTAKTTLTAAFVEAACGRGEHTLFVSFDSDAAEVIRNLDSVGIRLQRFVKSGVLKMISARAIEGSAEIYMMRIKTLALEHKARCLVIDPISTWSKSGSDLSAQSVAERLIDWSKTLGITLVCTRLLDEISSPTEGGAPLQISALADTWIHLAHLQQAGERNRSLSIIKSRGSAHSNQVRELMLSDTGITLVDTYTAAGEVLMGTLRWQKERAERMDHETAEVAENLKRIQLDAEEAELLVRLKSLEVHLLAKQVEKTALVRAGESRESELSLGRIRVGELRGADSPTASNK